MRDDMPAGSSKIRVPTIIAHIILVFGAILMLMPFVYMILTSFKTVEEATRIPPTWFVQNPTIDNYRHVLGRLKLPIYFKNTMILTVCFTAGELLFCSLAAYAFARISFPFRNAIFIGLLCVIMIPFQMTIIPNYKLMVSLRWVNTYRALIIPYMGSVFGVFFLRQFFSSLPREYDEAAKIDGCSHSRIFWQIMLPLSSNALITLGILTVLSCWNDLLWPLLIINDENMYVLSVGLALLQKAKGFDLNIVLAAGALVTVPSILLFVFGQRYFKNSVITGGVKG